MPLHKNLDHSFVSGASYPKHRIKAGEVITVPEDAQYVSYQRLVVEEDAEIILEAGSEIIIPN